MRRANKGAAFAPFSIVMTLLLIAVVAVIFIFMTPAGTQTLVGAINLLGSGIELHGVKGTLLSKLEVKRFVFENDKVRVEVDDVGLDLHKRFIDDGHLKIKSFDSKQLRIITFSGEPRIGPAFVPDIKIPPMDVNQLDIEKLVISLAVDDPALGRLVEDRFVINTLGMSDAVVKDGWLRANNLYGEPMIASEPMDISITKPALELANPHKMSGDAVLAYQHPLLGVLDADVKIGGTLTKYSLLGEGDLSQNDHLDIKGRITIDALGSFDDIEFTPFTAKTSQGDIAVEGKVAWQGGLGWDLSVRTNDLNTASFQKDWPAILDVNGSSAGTIIDGRPEFYVDLNSATGTVRDFPLKAFGRLQYEDGVIQSDAFEAYSNNSYIKVDGRATEPFDLEWDINAPNLMRFLPAIKGSIKGKGRLQGGLQHPIGEGKLTAKDIEYQDFILKKATLDFTGQQPNQAVQGNGVLHLAGLQYQSARIKKAEITLNADQMDNGIKAKGHALITAMSYQNFHIAEADINFDAYPQHDGRVNAALVGQLKKIGPKSAQLGQAALDISGSWHQGI